MKLLRQSLNKYLPKNEEPKLVHAIQHPFTLKYLDSPILSSEVRCPICDGSNGYAVFIDPMISDKRMWFCADSDCLATIRRSQPTLSGSTGVVKRSIEWPVFCQINEMGDIAHEVCFEKIEQGMGKIEYLLKFSSSPKGIILMEGNPGTGKTYAATGLCELFTRTKTSCLFFSAHRLYRQWLNTFNTETPTNFREKVMETNLLVIDDFGTGEQTPAFMGFFMELINTRLQWSNRGTVITTNLDDKKFSQFCGEALSDRINTGQKFQFKDKSRRKQTVL